MTHDGPRPSAAHDHNRRAWDEMVKRKQRFTRPARDEDLNCSLERVDPLGWLEGSVAGKELLCLGAGGGRQSAIYAAAGANVTVVDISPHMLELDRLVAAERELPIRTVEASMDHMPMLPQSAFDVVIHPVSTCYVPSIAAVYREVARVMSPGGIYVSQHKTPTSLQADTDHTVHGYALQEPYYRSGPLPAVVGSPHREEGTLEYLHRWEEIIGGMCRSGFVIEDLVEPKHADATAHRGSFPHRSHYVAPYVRIKARRIGQGHSQPTATPLWLP